MVSVDLHLTTHKVVVPSLQADDHSQHLLLPHGIVTLGWVMRPGQVRDNLRRPLAEILHQDCTHRLVTGVGVHDEVSAQVGRPHHWRAAERCLECVERLLLLNATAKRVIILSIPAMLMRVDSLASTTGINRGPDANWESTLYIGYSGDSGGARGNAGNVPIDPLISELHATLHCSAPLMIDHEQ